MSSSPWAAGTPAPSSRETLRKLGIADPAGQGLDAVRPIRDDIEERVRRLLADLNVAATR